MTRRLVGSLRPRIILGTSLLLGVVTVSTPSTVLAQTDPAAPAASPAAPATPTTPATPADAAPTSAPAATEPTERPKMDVDETLIDDTEPTPEEVELAKKPKVQWGIGGRIRYVTMPAAVSNLFVDQSTPIHTASFGLELVRRRKLMDISFSLDVTPAAPQEGYWVESGGDPAGGDADYLTSDGFLLVGLDVSFLWNRPIAHNIDFRYGVGLGVGVILGDIIRTDAVCPGVGVGVEVSDRNCTHPGPGRPDEDIPPAVPIINALVGLRFQLSEEVALNVETGFRNLFFFGVGASYAL